MHEDGSGTTGHDAGGGVPLLTATAEGGGVASPGVLLPDRRHRTVLAGRQVRGRGRRAREPAARAAALTSAYALLLILTGCTSDAEDFMDQRQEQDAQLAERPSSESEVARLTEVRDAVRSRIEADLGLASWTVTGDGGSAVPRPGS